ncbi:UNVERIFIED_CONTAM: hypothetical protein K2H54_020353 [Gekko kuhli]
MVSTCVGESGNDVTYGPSPTADATSSTALMSTWSMMRTKTTYAAYGPMEVEEAAQNTSENAILTLLRANTKTSVWSDGIPPANIETLHVKNQNDVLHVWGTWSDVLHIHRTWIDVLHALEIWHGKENHSEIGHLPMIQPTANDLETVGAGSFTGNLGRVATEASDIGGSSCWVGESINLIGGRTISSGIGGATIETEEDSIGSVCLEGILMSEADFGQMGKADVKASDGGAGSWAMGKMQQHYNFEVI